MINSSVDTVVILILLSIPVTLSLVLVGLAIWTNRSVAAIKAMQERKAAEHATHEAAAAIETARAEMEHRLSRQIEKRSE